MSIANTATVKMVQNVINGTTPLKAAAIGDAAFPVGTILQRTDSVSPASLFGGTWERIAGRFLLGDAGGGDAWRNRRRRNAHPYLFGNAEP